MSFDDTKIVLTTKPPAAAATATAAAATTKQNKGVTPQFHFHLCYGDHRFLLTYLKEITVSSSLT